MIFKLSDLIYFKLQHFQNSFNHKQRYLCFWWYQVILLFFSLRQVYVCVGVSDDVCVCLWGGGMTVRKMGVDVIHPPIPCINFNSLSVERKNWSVDEHWCGRESICVSVIFVLHFLKNIKIIKCISIYVHISQSSVSLVKFKSRRLI